VSWRFRKSFKVIPGVKLNLTNRGLSATFGAAAFSVNVGPRGVYRNVSIPGTGIWDRQRIGGPQSPSPHRQLPDVGNSDFPAAPPGSPVSPASSTEIHSASTELLTSESLEQLRRLLTEAYHERDELTREVSTATSEANTATRRYENWERGFLLKKVFKRSFATRKEVAETATAKLEELQEQLRLTTIATEIAVDREQAEPYYRMRDAFAVLSESQKIWNVLTEKAIDRVAERSNANTAVTRTPLPFSLNSCDLIQWDQKVPHLPNRTGGDMYIFPGFILYRASKQAFALIESRDVTLRFVSTQFTETDPIPSDSQIVGRTWAKCNKDGSPDRRFRDNYQIPIAHYGTLLFSSRDGLDVRYICSNPRSAEEFVKAWTAFQMSFGSDTQKRPPSAVPGDAYDATGLILRGKEAFERHRLASEAFSAAHKQFSNTILAVAQEHQGEQSCKATLSKEDFESYAAAVSELIASAKNLEENSPFVTKTARVKFQRAIQILESAWTGFGVVSEGRLNGDGLVPFFNAVTAFLTSQQEFFEIGAAALEKKAKKLGAAGR
jgi:hypothetical protein